MWASAWVCAAHERASRYFFRFARLTCPQSASVSLQYIIYHSFVLNQPTKLSGNWDDRLLFQLNLYLLANVSLLNLTFLQACVAFFVPLKTKYDILKDRSDLQMDDVSPFPFTVEKWSQNVAYVAAAIFYMMALMMSYGARSECAVSKILLMQIKSQNTQLWHNNLFI